MWKGSGSMEVGSDVAAHTLMSETDKLGRYNNCCETQGPIHLLTMGLPGCISPPNTHATEHILIPHFHEQPNSPRSLPPTVLYMDDLKE